MKTEYTNSRGEYITVGQLAVRTTVYAIGAVVAAAASIMMGASFVL